MDATFEPSTIYVSIDALFDTRAAVLATFSAEQLETAITKGYYDRVVDSFEGIDDEAFKLAYSKRDKAILTNAMITPVIDFIQYFTKQTLIALLNSPYRRQPKLVLNTFPYVLTKEEDQAIITGLRAVTEKMIDIEIIHVTLDNLTPDYVRKNYVAMVMYDYWNWLEIHSVNRNLVESKCQNIALIGPRLIKSREAAKQLEDQDAFSAIESYTGLFIKLQLDPANMFCVDLPRLQKSKAQ